MTDVIFDHFLARRWAQYGPCPLPEFADNALACVHAWGNAVPESTRLAMRRMHKNRTLERYADPEFVVDVLAHIGTRLRRSNPLGDAGSQFLAHEATLAARFEVFIPLLLAYTQDWRDGSDQP